MGIGEDLCMCERLEVSLHPGRLFGTLSDNSCQIVLKDKSALHVCDVDVINWHTIGNLSKGTLKETVKVWH